MSDRLAPDRSNPTAACGGARATLFGWSDGRVWWIAEQVPGFAVGGEEVFPARVVFAGEEEAAAAGDYADGDDEPGVFGDDVGGDEVEVGGGVGDDAAVGDALDAELVAAVAHAGAGFYLDEREFFCGGLEDEIVAVHLSVGLGDDVAEAHGLADEGDFAEVATLGDAEAAELGGGAGKALLGRGRASVGLGFGH